MESSAARLATVLLFVAILGQGYAIKCWSCTSARNRDSACLDPFNKMNQIPTDCDDHRSSSVHSSYATAVCKKIKYRESDDGELITLRKCDWVNNSYENRDKKIQDCNGTSTLSHWKIEYCAICSEDGCNGSHRVATSSAWCVLLPAFLYLFFKVSSQ